MGRGKTWTREESATVASAWKLVSANFPSSREQNTKRFAAELHQQFIQLAPKVHHPVSEGQWAARSQTAVKTQFDVIGDDILKFNVVLLNVMECAISRGIQCEELHIIRVAIAVHLGIIPGTSQLEFDDYNDTIEADWKLYEAWRVLRTCSRFAPASWSSGLSLVAHGSSPSRATHATESKRLIRISKHDGEVKQNHRDSALFQGGDETNLQISTPFGLSAADNANTLVTVPACTTSFACATGHESVHPPTFPLPSVHTLAKSSPLVQEHRQPQAAQPVHNVQATPSLLPSPILSASVSGSSEHTEDLSSSIGLAHATPLKRKSPCDTCPLDQTETHKKILRALTCQLSENDESKVTVAKAIQSLSDALDDYNAISFLSLPGVQGHHKQKELVDILAEKYICRAKISRDRLVRQIPKHHEDA